MSASDWGMADEAAIETPQPARSLADRLRKVMDQAGCRTQAEFAAQAGIPVERIKNLLIGRVQVLRDEECQAIERQYGWCSGWLRTGRSAEKVGGNRQGRRGRQPRPRPDNAALARVRHEMEKAGITVAEWARENGFSRTTVMDVLLGRRAGHSGEAHRVCIALGLKAGRVVNAKGWKAAAAAVGAQA